MIEGIRKYIGVAAILACSFGSQRSMYATTARTASTGEASCRRYSADSSTAPS